MTQRHQDRSFRREDYSVIDVPLVVCQRMTQQYHYAKGGSNTGVYKHGLIHKSRPASILGIAWWLPPTKGAAQATYAGDWRKVISLSRLVIVPEVPKNAATFLIAHSVDMIRAEGRFECLVTYADLQQGHTGTIYRASNWEYLGLTKPTTTWVDPASGRRVALKATRTRSVQEMRALGYVKVGAYAKHKFRIVLAPSPRRLVRELEEQLA